MERRTHLIFASILLLVLAGWWFTERGDGSTDPATDAIVQGTDPLPEVSPEETQRQFAALELDRQAQAEELSRRGAERDKFARAGAKTAEFRKQLQFTKSAAWSRVLTANAQTYQNLRFQAAAASDGTVKCTICNGRGAIHFCILCENSGKCPTCLGTGLFNFSSTELCPTCLGTGKCYLCGGTGNMVCPYCNDGIVDVKSKHPPDSLPID